jgi:hypothetical protein
MRASVRRPWKRLVWQPSSEALPIERALLTPTIEPLEERVEVRLVEVIQLDSLKRTPKSMRRSSRAPRRWGRDTAGAR